MRWKQVKLNDCCLSISDGDHQPPPKSSDGIPFVTIANINSTNQFEFSDTMYVPLTYYDALDAKRRAQKGDILYSVVGSFGIPVLIKENRPFVFQRHLAILRPDNEVVDSRFLYYSMLNKDFFAKADHVAIGAAQRTISLTALRNLAIALPPLAEQRRIADILSAYDDLIENNKKQIKLLEEAAQRLYKEWFIDLRFPGHEHTQIVNGIPEGWKRGCLKDFVTICYGKDHKNIPDGPIPVYGSGGLMRKCSQSIFSGESILIPRKGSLNNILYRDEAFWTVDTMFYTKMKIKDAGGYVYFYLCSYDMNAMNIGAAVPSMTTSILNAMSILLPTEDILFDFQRRIKAFFKQTALLNHENDKTASARDLLLPKLMRGKERI